ncbi:MAG: thiamine pyrophosphate-dependent dehydrogenase E1 component subunit alpha [bacterium]|nr:thiamine pyrophosphate-dependent dehydrogenase E1 component subunit alpha [bacterium]
MTKQSAQFPTPASYGIPEELPDIDYGVIKRDEHARIYRWMLLGRRVEETAISLYRQGKVVGGVYPGIGHEAITVGSTFPLLQEDWLAPMHRDLTAQMVKGQPSKFVFSQYLGRKNSPTHGKDGSVHLSNYDYNINGCISHIGAMLPFIVGVTYAGKQRGESCCAVTYFGDGGVSIGDFHEGMNFASVVKAPILVFIENNQFAYSTPLDKQYNIKSQADRAIAYGIPGISIDGNNVLAVVAATKHFLNRARAGKGPALIECVTMRILGHSAHDAADYVPGKMLEEWKKFDPIPRYQRYLLRKKILSEREFGAIEASVEEEIRQGVEWAEAQPYPAGWEAGEGVYATGLAKRSNKLWE